VSDEILFALKKVKRGLQEMTIYGKNLYATKPVRKSNNTKKIKKNQKISVSGVTGKAKIDLGLDKKYGVATKRKCRGCGKLIFLIKGIPHELEPDSIGCHDKHNC